MIHREQGIPMKRITVCAIAAVLSGSVFSSLAVATYITDIGYDTLQAQLGAAAPTGTGVRVAQTFTFDLSLGSSRHLAESDFSVRIATGRQNRNFRTGGAYQKRRSFL
jgi:hypothetical protein